MQPLTNVPIGKTYTIRWVLGNSQIETIFNKIGLVEGMPIKLIQNLNRSVLVRYGKQVYGMSSDVASRINTYHSKVKNFLRQRRGVSTKYLSNYLVWHDLMFCSARSREELEKILMGTALAARIRVRCRELSRRAPVPAGA